MAQDQTAHDDGGNKHEAARRMAEAGVQAQAAGDDDRADALLDAAGQTDPEAVEDVLARDDGGAPADRGLAVQDDAEIAALSRTIEPDSAAPSRAGITGAGSGADASR